MNCTRLLLIITFVYSLIFSSCNHTIKKEIAETNSDTDSTMIDTFNTHIPDSIILKSAIVNSTLHQFSDPLNKDSFVAEMPAGNILKSKLLIKIYSYKGVLLFLDSLDPTKYFSESLYYHNPINPDKVLEDLNDGINEELYIDNFTSSKELKKNAALEINDSILFNQTIAVDNAVVFNYKDIIKLQMKYISYSQKLKKAVIIAHEYEDTP